MDHLIITKASGEKTEFSVEKLKVSLRQSGAGNAVVAEVLHQLKPLLYEGITTKKIYKHAFTILKRISKPTAARYSLKKGIMQLGPSGFPFEKFVAELLKAQGYTTEIGVFVNGRCVQHEIDVIAFKDGERLMIECKYHNQHLTKSNVRIPMYIHSRFKDVELDPDAEEGAPVRFHQGWVVTNTRFTEDAIRYASCMHIHLLGWDFPSKAGLKDMVDSYGLYPLTCLTTLSKAEKQKLLNMQVVLCRELLHNKKRLGEVGVKKNHQQSVLNEVENLCGGHR